MLLTITNISEQCKVSRAIIYWYIKTGCICPATNTPKKFRFDQEVIEIINQFEAAKREKRIEKKRNKWRNEDGVDAEEQLSKPGKNSFWLVFNSTEAEVKKRKKDRNKTKISNNFHFLKKLYDQLGQIENAFSIEDQTRIGNLFSKIEKLS